MMFSKDPGCKEEAQDPVKETQENTRKKSRTIAVVLALLYGI
jgi:hypothetical protein